jgi:hypothetical protein
MPAPAYLSDPSLILGYWKNSASNPAMPGSIFVVTKEVMPDPSKSFGPGEFVNKDGSPIEKSNTGMFVAVGLGLVGLWILNR